MRVYTAYFDGQPACSIAAHTISEARYVLAAILGCDVGITVRRATDDETAAWLATASKVERSKMRRRLTPKKNPAATNATGRKSQEYSMPVPV
jgi:hypothetical protein